MVPALDHGVYNITHNFIHQNLVAARTINRVLQTNRKKLKVTEEIGIKVRRLHPAAAAWS